MLITIANVLAGLIGAGIILIGVRAFWAPQAAAGFGIPDTPTEDPSFRAWLSVKAADPPDAVFPARHGAVEDGTDPHTRKTLEESCSASKSPR